MNQVFHSSTQNFDLHLTSLDLAHGDVQLNERCRLLSILSRSPPSSINQKFLPEFSSKLQELIPESFDGEIWSKLQLLFHPSNNSPLHELTELASYFLSNNTLNEKRTDEFLEWAIGKRPKELFRSLFAIKTPTVDAFSERILESIARTGKASILQLLIDCGLDVRYLAGIRGGRYLQLSLYHSSVDVAHLLLDNGADVNPPLGESPYDYPPLHHATSEGYHEIISRLLEADARVDAKVDNCTALSYAVLDGNVDIVRQLLQAGADVDTGDHDGCETLDWAYLHQPSIYRIISPISRKAKTSLTIHGILSAANRGKQVLSQYLDGHRGKNIRSAQMELETALLYAITEKQSSAVISVLLEFGVDPNTETVNTSYPPLRRAATNYDINLAERLLNAGARIDSPGVLEAVAYSENGFDTLNFLIEQGADVLAFGGNALRNAISGNNLGGIKLLMSSGVNINDASLCADGYTYLARAARYTEIKTVKYLVDNGAIANAPPSIIAGITALQAGAAAGNLEVVKFLLDIGSDVNAEPSSRYGTTALEASLDSYELKEEHAAIFQLLLDKGADINGPRKQRRSMKWNSALVTLIAKCASSHLIQRALNAGADVNRRGKGEGARTPLQAAAEVGNLELVKQLLEKGAKINARPSANYGRTALQAACSSDNPNLELTRYLLKEGAEVNAAAGIKRGLTGLQGAAIQGHIKIALVLLDAGAEVNAEPAEIEGRMALDGAAEHGRLDMVQLLFNFGAKSEVSGDTGFDNAIKLARKNGHFAVAKLLEAQSTS
jgi:ankyrin repeat protein